MHTIIVGLSQVTQTKHKLFTKLKCKRLPFNSDVSLMASHIQASNHLIQWRVTICHLDLTDF